METEIENERNMLSPRMMFSTVWRFRTNAYLLPVCSAWYRDVMVGC